MSSGHLGDAPAEGPPSRMRFDFWSGVGGLDQLRWEVEEGSRYDADYYTWLNELIESGGSPEGEQ